MPDRCDRVCLHHIATPHFDQRTHHPVDRGVWHLGHARSAIDWPTSFLRGTAAAGGIALVNSIGNVGGFAGPYLMGWMREATGGFRRDS